MLKRIIDESLSVNFLYGSTPIKIISNHFKLSFGLK